MFGKSIRFSKKIIDKEKIMWQNINEYMSTTVTDSYAISIFPLIIIFNPDGTINTRDLKCENFKIKLGEIFKN